MHKSTIICIVGKNTIIYILITDLNFRKRFSIQLDTTENPGVSTSTKMEALC